MSAAVAVPRCTNRILLRETGTREPPPKNDIYYSKFTYIIYRALEYLQFDVDALLP